MTDIKDLPSEVELDALAQTDEYQTIDDTLTVKQLQMALTDIDVDYLSADNKPDLIWRYMDAQDTLPADEPVTPSDDAPVEPASDETATVETVEPTPVETVETAPVEPTPEPVIEPVQSQNRHERRMARYRNRGGTPAVARPASNTVSVRNTGSFNVLEPLTTTLMKAGEVTEIEIVAGKPKDKIVANINQFNMTRGNILKIIE